jgi:S1-C subfamily serine protease
MRVRLCLVILAALAAFGGRHAAVSQTATVNPDVYVANRYTSPITRLFASPVTDDSWGQERLSGATIRPGTRGELRPERGRGCMWDIRVIYQNGREEEKRRVELCSIAEVVFNGENARMPQQHGQQNQLNPPRTPQEPQTPPQQQTQPQTPPQPPRSADTMIINQGPATVVGLFAQAASGGDWGQDRLGSGTLRAAGRFHLRLPAEQGCSFNLRIQFAGGAVDNRSNVDLCGTPEVLLSGRAQPGQAISSGTGFYVSRAGHVLTTFHTVRNCSAVSVARQGGQRIAMVRVADDAENDLALYRIPDLVSPVAPFRMAQAPVRPGERLVVVGYPARRMLGQVAVVESSVTSATGARGEATRFQFQGGPVEEPWGAPIYDQNGLVVGIANDPQFMGRAGTAVSREAIQRFLKAHNVEAVEVPAGETRRVPSMQDYAFPVVLPLDCIN